MHLAIDIQANESTKSEVPEVRKVSLDIQAILTVIGRRKNSFNNGEANFLDLKTTYLEEIDLWEAHLEGANLNMTPLEESDLYKAHLEGTNFGFADLAGTNLEGAKNLTIDQLSKVETL